MVFTASEFLELCSYLNVSRNRLNNIIKTGEEILLKYICTKDNIRTKSSVCPVCGERTELEKSDIYWLKTAKFHCMTKHASVVVTKEEELQQIKTGIS